MKIKLDIKPPLSYHDRIMCMWIFWTDVSIGVYGFLAFYFPPLHGLLEESTCFSSVVNYSWTVDRIGVVPTGGNRHKVCFFQYKMFIYLIIIKVFFFNISPLFFIDIFEWLLLIHSIFCNMNNYFTFAIDWGYIVHHLPWPSNSLCCLQDNGNGHGI